MKMLIVEDELSLLESIKQYMHSEGYVCESAKTFFDAETKLGVYQYEIVLLDITLPGGNGLDLIHTLKKQHPETGILIISAKNALDDKINGLDLGADDYICKPFHLSELNSRINAVIRRRNFNGRTNLIFNEIEIDTVAKEVTVHNKEIKLTRKEYDLLLYCIINKKRVLTKESIAEHLSGDAIDMADNFDFIYTHIKNLRKKIEQEGGTDYLKTVYGLGYKFSDL